MTLLHDSVETKKLDVRMIERNLARGVIQADEVDKAIKKLPDDEDNAEWTSIEDLADDGEESMTNGHGDIDA